MKHAKMSLYSKIEDTNADIDIYREGKWCMLKIIFSGSKLNLYSVSGAIFNL